MGSGVKQNALANAGSGQSISNSAVQNAGDLYGTLAPVLTNESINPQGIAPADLAKMNTAAQQSAGGSMSGAVGQGSLLAARTKNAGTADAAIAKSAESAGQNLSNQALNVQNENTQTKLKQQQQGLGGLESLYGTNEGEAVSGLSASNSALNAANAAQPYWQKLLSQGIQAGGQVAAAAM